MGNTIELYFVKDRWFWNRKAAHRYGAEQKAFPIAHQVTLTAKDLVHFLNAVDSDTAMGKVHA